MSEKLIIPSVDAIDLINTYGDMCMVESQYEIEIDIPKSYKDFYFSFFTKRNAKQILSDDFISMAEGRLERDRMGRYHYVNDVESKGIHTVDKIEKLYATLIYLDKCGSLANGFSVQLPYIPKDMSKKEKLLLKICKEDT